MNLFRVIFTFLLLSNFATVYSQGDLGTTTQISLEQGLSDRTIKDIAKDRDGYIWIATRNGLNRYDGLHIVNYDNHPNSQTRISFKDISKILCRKDGSLVIQYENNRRSVDVLKPSSTQAQNLFLNRENGVLGQVEKLYLSKRSGELYALVTKDSSLIVQKMNHLQRFDSVFTLQGYLAKPSSLYNFIITDRGSFWLSDNKIGLIQSDSFGTIQSTLSYDSLGLNDDAGLAKIFYQDRLGRVWLSFNNAPGLWEFNEAAGYFTPFQLENLPGTYDKLWEDELGNVMISTEDAGQTKDLFVISSDDAVDNFDQLLDQERDIKMIYSDDFERLLFVGTTSGVKKITLTKKRVEKFFAKNDTSNVQEVMRGIEELPDSTLIIAGSSNRWHRLNARRDSMTPIDFQLQHGEEVSYCDCARQLVYDHDGGLWGTRFSSTYRAELIKMDILTDKFSSYYFPQKIQSLILGLDGLIWLVSGGNDDENRLTSFDRKTKIFRHYFLADGTNPLRDYKVTYLFESKDRSKWIGTTTGLIRITSQGEMSIFQASDDYHGISSNLIYVVTEDSQHRIWIGTDGGVNIYDPGSGNKEEFIYYDTRDGLPDNNVCGIIEDDNGNMWFSTFNGLSYFDLSLRSFRNFGVADGFSNLEFNLYSFYKDKFGHILVGSNDGLNYFNPNELLERNLDAPILLSKLSYYDKIEGAIIENLHNLQSIKEVVLPASNRYFHCAFALADYAYPQLNQFQYKLEGLDIEWNSIGTQNEIRFNNLPAGNYILKIRGTDRNLNLSSRQFSLRIKVNQYFYKKAWFIFLCISAVLLAIYLFHRIRLRQVIQMERLRTKISSDLHDDVGGLLSGLAMQTELLEYTAADKDKPKLKRISDMSRNAMAQMRDVIWATDARKDRFEDLIVRMKEYAAEILFSRNITCHFHVKGILAERKLPVQVRQNLYLIFKEAITNVAKHSNATRADVSLIREGSLLQLIISDDGTEISENGHTSSLNGAGLKNMEMRAQNINADFSISKDKGFTVAVKMKAIV